MRIKLASLLLLCFSIFLASCSQQKTTQEYLQSGQEMLSKQDWKGAVIEFKNAIKQSPDNPEARVLLGKTYLSIFSGNAAVKELERASKLGYKDDSLMLLLGEAYRQINDNERVIKEIKASNSQSPRLQADIHALRARSLLTLKQPDEAKTELDLAKSLDESSPDVRIAWAEYEQNNKNIAAQKEWLKPLLEQGAEVADAWSQMGEIEQQEKNLEAAEEAFTRAINLRGVVHADVLKRAMVRISRNDLDAALEDINLLKKVGVQWPMVGYADGLIAYEQKRYAEGRDAFEKVLSQYPDYLPARLLLGLTQYEMDNYLSAEKNLGLYLANVPDSFQANLIYAVSLMKLARAADAIPVLEKLSKQDSNNFDVLSNLGNAYLLDNQLQNSVQALTGAIALKPESARVRLQLASALLREKSSLEKAQQELIKAIELDPMLMEADAMLFMSYLRAKEFTRAREVARVLSQKQPDKVIGINLMALSYLAEGNKVRAVEELKKALKLFPADLTAANNLAKIYLKDNKLAEAKAIYLNVLEKNPGDLESINKLALVAAKEGDQENVLGWLKKAVEKNPHNLSAKLSLAAYYLRVNEPVLAVKLLQNVTQQEKEDPGYMLLMAQAKMGAAEYQHATRLLKTLVAKNPDSIRAHYLLAKSYAYQNDPVHLRESLDHAIKLDPENLPVNLMAARLDLMEGKVDPFQKRMAMLVKKYPENKDVQFLNAKVDNKDKKYDSAISTLKSLMVESPHSQVVIDLSKNQWNSGDKGSAISSLELWLQDNPEDKDALLLLAQYYLSEKREPEATNAYQKLYKLSPGNVVVLNNLAWLMMDSDAKQAIAYAEQALKINPENPYVEDTLAMLLLKNGNNAKALMHSKAAALNAPTSFDIQLNYAKVLGANNRKEEARNLLNKFKGMTKDKAQLKAINQELNKL